MFIVIGLRVKNEFIEKIEEEWVERQRENQERVKGEEYLKKGVVSCVLCC